MAGQPSFGSGANPIQTPLEIFGGIASTDDLNLMVRVFGAASNRPDQIPQPFLSYFVDYIQTASIQISPSQITGQTLTVTPATAIGASDSITATSYVDATHAGPTISSLRSGVYIVFLGAVASISTTASTAFASLSVNGSTPVDTDGIRTSSTNPASIFGISQQELTDDTNSLTTQYRVSGGTGTFLVRQLIAVRYANL